MMTLITSILATWGPWIIGGIVGLGVTAGAYFKGKSNQKQKTALEDLKGANEIRKDGAAARAGVATDPDSLRQSDGFRRD